ncbi:MAG: class I SAM-dependent methyltransferase [Ignavibacteriaceae bacterium]|nr:class I SAM-dependent methyltransferase [Ignavibacteriaceae bacterium]
MQQNINKNYTSLAGFYNVLMKNIDYSSWAKYLFEITCKYNISVNSVLEIGGGNGKLANALSRKFPDYYLSDKSFVFLSEGKYKKNKICCDMTALPFKPNFNFVFAAFDTINYISSKKNFVQLLSEASEILNEDGVFTFDVSLENNSLSDLSGRKKVYDYHNQKIEHLSIYNEKRRIHTNEFIFRKDGKVIEKEIHKQKIFPFEFYLEQVDKSSFYIIDCLEAFGFRRGKPTSKRVQFILKKVK